MAKLFARTVLLAVSAALTVTACSRSGGVMPAAPTNSSVQAGQSILTGRTAVRPADFPDAAKITNPYLPYVPGTKYIFMGKLGKAPEKDVQFVTFKTRKIAGINCVIVLDFGYVSGRLEERTQDYYAQGFYGNVWYFGEYETSYHPHGHKSSWLSGVDGASPGIVMEATPRVGDQYYQENAPGVAEDQARVISLTQNVKTPFGSFFGNVLETKEFSKLEPGVIDHKYYEPGYGLMEDDVVRGGREILKLTGIIVKHKH
jgi:hypothetical protein